MGRNVLLLIAIFAVAFLASCFATDAIRVSFVGCPAPPSACTIPVTASTSKTLQVTVTDDKGNPLRSTNTTVAFSQQPSRVSVALFVPGEPFATHNVTHTNYDGMASVTAHVGFNPGTAVVVATATAVDGSTASATATLTVAGKAFTQGWIAIGIIMALAVVHIIGTLFLAAWILRNDTGTIEMREISDPIKEGAQGFFRTQYLTIASMAIPVSVIIFILYMIRAHSATDPNIPKFAMALIIMFSFLIGAFCSGVAGLTGMWVAVRANIRVASAARRSYNGAIAIALRSGAFAGFLVVALSVLGVVFLFALLYGVIPLSKAQPQQIPLMLVGYGFGASFVALFAQLGGGIYTKAADVGADIIGKVEANIPEDDVRNPAVIADLVGDNVGDCAGRGADLFESIAAENIGAMILAGTLAATAYPQISDPIAYIAFPLAIHVMGLIASWVGIFCVRVPEKGVNFLLGPGSNIEKRGLLEGHREGINREGEGEEVDGSSLADPMSALNRGYAVTVVLALVGFFGCTYWLLHDPNYPGAWWHFAICGVIGIITSWAFVFITIYYTDFKWWPVKRIAEASQTGAGTNVIAGIAVGLESCAMPILVIAVAILSAYYTGASSGLKNQYGLNIGGLFGTAVATMGMLASAGFILAMDTFGPITDNAGGIVEMSQLPKQVRVITDRLDAVGNTTKALTKGYAIGSASLAAFLLFRAYLDEITAYIGRDFYVVDLATPEVFIGALIGAMLVFLFSSLAIRAVGKSAQALIQEVRRQFREKPGIMTYDEKPDYQRCVAMVARSALIQMILPGLVPVLAPIAIGFIFRLIGYITHVPTLGAEVSAGFLMVATIAGILMALFFNNGGGAWDNAKKFIEMGNYGGKGSETHKAAVIGDTVGDPFKDTAGPSLHVLIKLLATITLVVGPLFLNKSAYASS